MPFSSGPGQLAPHLGHWVGPDRFAWLRRNLLAAVLVVGEYLLLRPFTSRLDDLFSLCVSWVVLFLLPDPAPRLLLLAARFAAVGATLMNLRTGMQRLEALSPSLASWTLAFAVAWFALMAAGIVWMLLALRPARRPVHATVTAAPAAEEAAMETGIPDVNFAAVGGFERIKDEIRLIAENRFRRNANGIVRNGILLYGPQGTGKNLIAEATAGEFRVNFHHVRCPELVGVHVGSTSAEIRRLFEWAYQHRPMVLFLDEVDSIGSRKQAQGAGTDAGGGGREYNTVTTQLMQSIDRSRRWDGFLLVAATNYLDGLEPTLIRDGRFDAKLRLDLPDEAGRAEILRALLVQVRSRPFDVAEVARRTPGWSPARLRSLVDRAALRAGEGAVEHGDLIEALESTGGWDRPNFERVEWDDVVLPQAVVDDLKMTLRLLKPGEAERLGVPPPTGLILTGPPGTGKTLTARLIASQSGRSFYPLTPADVLSGAVGGSVRRLAEVFARAKENAPSILFFDELDALFPNAHGHLSHHDLQLVEQALVEISGLSPKHNVFLIGTTNHIEYVEPRILRGGRFSEKIGIECPTDQEYHVLLCRHLDGIPLGDGVTIDELMDRIRGLSPSDLGAVITAAKRANLRRLGERTVETPLALTDIEEGIQKIACQTDAHRTCLNKLEPLFRSPRRN